MSKGYTHIGVKPHDKNRLKRLQQRIKDETDRHVQLAELFSIMLELLAREYNTSVIELDKEISDDGGT